jgi:hypothetical protein
MGSIPYGILADGLAADGGNWRAVVRVVAGKEHSAQERHRAHDGERERDR